MNKKILLVDDEKNILSAYKRVLRNDFIIFLADDPRVALEILKKHGSFAAVVSDYKMPYMDGLQLLEEIKKNFPETVRLLLTGYADLNTAIEAINKSNIFRLLTKPCRAEEMKKALNDAVQQYNLIISEKELLNKTLKGALSVLIDILSSVHPLVFNFTIRFKNLAEKIAERLHYKDMWEVEISALLMHIGLVSVPSEIIEKKLHGVDLTPDENKIYKNHAELGYNLISKIPRLENVAINIKYQLEPYFKLKNKYKDNPDDLPFVALILKTLTDYFELLAKGFSEKEAVAKMEKAIDYYEPEVFGALVAEISGIEEGKTIKIISIKDLRPGMVLGGDLFDKNGLLLLPKGTKITPVTYSKIINYAKMTKLKEPLEIIDEVNDKLLFRKD